ncbi:MAG TPA: tetratricopeptide repeat protein [Isosphaeraceae bacterium]|jgi:serine/threonine protein kinase|nr:tetratricopeptide repeat protein [Isosphaeraceae bacterium]
MEPDDRELKAVFCGAVDLPAGPEREAYLDRACPAGTPLRPRVEALLRAHDASGRFLGTAGVAATAPDPDLASVPDLDGDAPGARIGPYTLVERLGEGGMGAVFLAEQEEPVRRRVALKVIRPGMDSRAVVARFEAERQALALMDHPNIARVLDAGATPAGRPYFVMELVQGVPITDYCDSARLTPAQRLELFIPVCQAVQHAHQKGIIHRDIKPSNVLVATIDGRPVPKVIDFGVARAIDRRQAEMTMFTQLGAIVGTPEYMSPEQAEPSEQDIDTRSDIYSLGVLLYELLTGTTPLDRDTLRRAALAEVLRRVREEDPPTPSTRLSDTADRLPSVAAVRGVEPSRLSRLVRGDLDWIVMKALEKDRSRRYDSASAFAADVRRHLDGDPVEAGPPTRSYRLRKFARKHRVALATAAAFLLVLIAATAISTYQAWRATRAEKLAEQRLGETKKAQEATQQALVQSEQGRQQAEAVSAFLISAFRSPDPDFGDRNVKVVDVLGRGEEQLDRGFTGSEVIRGHLLDTLGQTYLGLGWPDRALKVFEKASEVQAKILGADHPDTLISRSFLGIALRAVGRTGEAIKLHEAVLARRTATLGADHPDTLISRNNLAQDYFTAGRTAEAIALYEAALKLFESKLGANHFQTLSCRNNLALAYMDAGRVAEAITLFEPTLKLLEAARGVDHPETLKSRMNLAQAYDRVDRTAEAIALDEATVKLLESKLGPDHLQTLVARHNLASMYSRAGRTAKAITLFEPTLKLFESKLDPEHPHILTARCNLAAAYVEAGRVAEGIKLHEATLALQETKLGPDHPETLDSRNNLATAYWRAGRLDRSVPLFEQVLRQRIARSGPDHPETLRIQANLGVNYRDAGRPAEGARLMEDALRRARGRPEARAATVWVVPQLVATYHDLGRWDDAEPLLRDLLAQGRKTLPPDSPDLAAILAHLGLSQLHLGRWPETETTLRECLKIRAAKLPDHWSRFNTMSQLGGALLGQGRHAEAEPLIVEGYEGLKARAATIPPRGKPRLPEAAEQVVRLYESWGKPEKAAAWRARLGLLPADVFARP